MGGKSTKSTQSVTIPPEVMARYNAVNTRAEGLADRPFQQYSTDPSAFVAQLTPTQQQGIQQTQQYAQSAQPYFQYATNQLQQAQQQGQAGLNAAYPSMQYGIQQGQQLGQQAYGGYQNMLSSFMPTYQQAQQGIQQGLGAGQNYLGQATNFAMAGSQAVNPQQFSQQAVNQYMSPYVSNVVDQTMKAQAQQNAQQRQGLTGDAIKAGAFGGDRAGIGQANLAYQQNLANQQTIAGLYNQGYGQAAQMFQQQQGVNLAADQANRQAMQQTGQALAGFGQQAYGMGTGAAQQQAQLGQALAGLYGQQAQGLAGLGQQQFGQGMTAAQQQAALAQMGYQMGSGTAQQMAQFGQGAQQAGISGAQAMMGAGTLEQQTNQAGLQALYNQFLQQQGYDFQVAQFLANIAMGTGALSGSTTTSTQPTSFFSDKRLKDDIEPIGETYDGQKIVKFNYKGSPQKQIGLVAQDVEKHHPDAVGVAAGFKTVDYDKATKDAAKIGHSSTGGGVVPDRSGEGFADGGYAAGGAPAYDPNNIQQILASQQQMFGQGAGQGSPLRNMQGTPGATGRVPAANLPVGQLMKPSSPMKEQPSALSQGMSAAATGEKIAELAQKAKAKFSDFTKKDGEQFGPPQPGLGGASPASPASAAASAPAVTGKTADAGGILESAPGGGKIDVADLAADKSKDLISDALSFAWTGGRINKAMGGEADDKDTSAPEGLYKPEGPGINIPNESSKQKPLEPAKGDGGKGGGGSGLGTIASLASTAAKIVPFFLADGGVVPRHGYAVDGTVIDPEKDEKPKGVARVAAVNAADTGATGVAPKAAAPAPADAGVAPKAAEPSNFDRSVNRTFQFEGGLNKADTNGAPSLYGINAKYHPDFFQNPSKEKAAQIYKSQYWDAIGGDKLDPNMAHVAFDTAVVAGPAKAKELMAQADGDPQKLLMLRKDFQDSLIAKNPEKYGKYQNAWNNRIATLTSDISGDKPEGQGVAAPGVAGPGRPIRTASNSPFSAITEGLLPADTSKKTRDILTSENFWVPALSGIGSMLASKSPTLGPAIGEGLLGATAAYTGLNKQQADIGQTMASTEKTMADVAGSAIQTDPNGVTRVRYITPQGGYSYMPITEFNRLRRSGQTPKIDPRDQSIIFEQASKAEGAPVGGAGGAGAGQPPIGAAAPANVPPAGQPVPKPGAVETAPLAPVGAPKGETAGAPPAPTAPAAPAAPEPSATEPYIQLSPELKKKYEDKGRQLVESGRLMAQDQPDVFTPQMKVAQGANNQRGQIAELATSLAASPRSKSLLASGEAQKVLQPLALTLNGYAAAIGIPPVLDAKDVANAEAVTKAVNMLKTAAAKDGNQNAFAALDQFGSTFPSKLNSPQGQAQLLAQVYYNNQREIDKQNYYSQILKAAGGQDGEYAQFAMRSGLEADSDFNKEYSQAKYAKEIKSLERMFNEGPKGMTANGRPITWIEFLNKEGGTLTPKERQQIEKQFGSGILRYFGV